MALPHRLLTLLLAGAALYAALAALYPLGAGLLRPRLTWAQQADASAAAGLAHLAIYAGLFAAYALAIRWLARARDGARGPTLGVIVVGWLTFSAIGLLSFPGESADVFDYLFRGRMMTEYGLSPLAHTPYEIRDRPFHRYVSWSQWVDAYGPIWEYASAAVSALAQRFAAADELRVVANQTCEVQPALCTLLTRHVAAYRLLAIGLTGACAALIAAVVARRDRRDVPLALALWLWNPLVIVSTAIGAHNDALMLVFILLAVWLAQRERWLWAVLAVAAAAHVKLTALVMLPPLALWMLDRRGLRRAVVTSLAALVIALPASYALYAPLGGWETLPRNLYERSLLSSNSPAALIQQWLRESHDWPRYSAQNAASRAALAAFALAAGAILLWAWLRRARAGDTFAHWVHTATIVVIAYLAIGSYWFQAWYLVWPLALAALIPRTALARIALPLFCAGALMAAVLSDYLRAGEGVPASIVNVAVVGVIILSVAIGAVAVRRAPGRAADAATSTP